MSYDVTYAPSFASLPSEWTTDPHYGTVSVVSSKLRCYGASHSAPWHYWLASNHYPVAARVAFADMGLGSIVGLVSIKSRVELTASGAWNDHGFGLYADDSNVHLVSVANNGGFNSGRGRRVKALGDSWTNGSQEGGAATADAYLLMQWNNSAEAKTDINGNALAAGKVVCYISRDSGSTWTTVQAAETLAAFTPTHVQVFGRVNQPSTPTTTDFSAFTVTVTLPGARPLTDEEKFARVLVDLYPPGAYPKLVDKNGTATLFADWNENVDAAVLGAAQGDLLDQLLLEVFPQTAAQTLDEWEAALAVDSSPGDTDADRREAVVAGARAALLCTPDNLRAALGELLASQYGFWDHGTDDVLAHYDTRRQAGNGSLTEGATGLIAAGTSPAQLPWLDPDLRCCVEHAIVDREDTFVLEAEMQAYTTGTDSAACLFVQDSLLDASLHLGVENVSGTTRARAMLYQDGSWTDLGNIAVPGATCWYRITRDADGLYQCEAGTSLGSLSSVAADVDLTWRPRTWGIVTRNLSPWNTCSGRWQDIRIAYGTQANNVELHEQRIDTIPAGSPEAIFRAFVHRDPDDTGSYDLANAQRVADRLTWGHTVITVGASDNFLTDDPNSLTDRDILGK